MFSRFFDRVRLLFRGGSRSAVPVSVSSPSPRAGDFYAFYGLRPEMTVAAVCRCVKLLSESVASLPVRYMKRRGEIFVESRGEWLSYLLNVQPDYNYSAFDFWKQVITTVLLDGNAYIVPVYNPVSLKLDRLALCGRNTVLHDTVNDRYSVTDADNGISGTYGEDEIIHIKGLPGSDPKHGVSVLQYAAQTIDTAGAGNAETLRRFRKGGNVRGIVSNSAATVRGFGPYQDNQLKDVADDLDGRFRNQDIVSLAGQVDFKQIVLSSVDMQFLESRRFTVLEICRFFGVHPSFLFEDTSSNYKSAEQANVAFLSHTLNPLLRQIECEFMRKLIAPSLAHKYRMEFDRRGLYACDLDSKVKYQASTIAAGLYTVNDWRKAENQEPVGGGDTVLVSANLRPLSDIGLVTGVDDSNNLDSSDDEK